MFMFGMARRAVKKNAWKATRRVASAGATPERRQQINTPKFAYTPTGMKRRARFQAKKSFWGLGK